MHITIIKYLVSVSVHSERQELVCQKSGGASHELSHVHQLHKCTMYGIGTSLDSSALIGLEAIGTFIMIGWFQKASNTPVNLPHQPNSPRAAFFKGLLPCIKLWQVMQWSTSLSALSPPWIKKWINKCDFCLQGLSRGKIGKSGTSWEKNANDCGCLHKQSAHAVFVFVFLVLGEEEVLGRLRLANDTKTDDEPALL